MRTRWMALVSLAVAAFLPVSAPAQWKTPWAYEGPRGAEHWSELDPGYAPCNTGKEQSPIDIQTAEKADLPVLRFDSKSAPLKYLVNNGYTIRVNYHDAPGTGSLLIVGDKRYQLTQFHFHRPSEEYIHGKPYDMVAHLMYQDSDGKVAGVAVLLRAGKANATIQQIWDHMPKTESKVLSDFSHEEQSVPGVDINPSGLLPRDTSYYMYMGSVTAPPCTEGVTWFVLKTPVEVSSGQISAFANLYPHDVRPIQPLNGRVVKESR
ncbi:MAG TPA: carbonic anhydrase family protein [Verrucomicrobiae bacterium]|jgi:carbonic anhydrase|nr:carbonic anhydrase family protein [Verrucomicrobiae bacterium]